MVLVGVAFIRVDEGIAGGVVIPRFDELADELGKALFAVDEAGHV